MDFINFNTEYESLSNFTKQGLNTLNSINLFLKTIQKQNEQLVNNSRRTLDNMFNEIIKYDSRSSMSKNIFDFSRSYENYLTKNKNVLVKFDKDIIEPVTLFSKHLTGKYQETLFELKNIINVTYESKKQLEKVKHKYFECCKLAAEQEKLVLKIMQDKEKNLATDEDIRNAHDLLFKMRSQSEENCQIYKIELNKTNKIYEENEKKYFPLIEKLKLNEENRISFVKFHFEKFSKIMQESADLTIELVNKMNNSIFEIKAEDDLKLFDERFNFLYKRNERIPREDFINYDIYRRNLEKILYSSQAPSDREIDETTDLTDISFNDDKEKLVDNFFKDIRSKQDEVSIDDLGNIMENLYNNLPFSKTLIDRFLVVYKNTLSINIPNYQNFYHLSNIMLSVINNIDMNNDYFEMNFAIIYISEKTSYINPDNKMNKIYLCSLISKNKQLTNKSYWLKLIEIKINSMTNQKVAREFKNKEENNNKNYDSYFSLNKVKNLFIQSNKKIDTKETVPQHVYDNIRNNEVVSALREYIPHFANFNLDVSIAIDIIVDLSLKYNFSKDKVSFFISLLNSNLFTIKNKSLCKNVDINKIYFNRAFKKYLSLNDHVLTTMAFSFKYLNSNDHINILLLNKTYNKKLMKILYKNILYKYHNMDTKFRLQLWSNILKINSLKKEINYKEVLQRLTTIENSDIKEIIILDVHRTPFDSDEEVRRNQILNILQAAAIVMPNINYCQGMNYIAAFILQLTLNEEEAFYFLIGLLRNTEYGIIFNDNLFKLKQFFYVFDRLLALYMPELHIYMKNNSVIVSYFTSPWFITLFSTSYQYISENVYPKVLIRIWDDFILNGWKAILKSALALVKNYESNLLDLKYEELLLFLINNIIKHGFFQNSNYENFIYITKSLKLQSGLISNLENEYLLEIKVKESDEQKKEGLKKIAYEKEHTIKI